MEVLTFDSLLIMSICFYSLHLVFYAFCRLQVFPDIRLGNDNEYDKNIRSSSNLDLSTSDEFRLIYFFRPQLFDSFTKNVKLRKNLLIGPGPVLSCVIELRLKYSV